jgi:hypothetical protein
MNTSERKEIRMKKLKLKKSKREIKKEIKIKEKKRRKKEKEETSKKGIKKPKLRRIHKVEDIITEEKRLVGNMRISQIRTYLREKYSQYRTLPVPEAIIALCDDHERLSKSGLPSKKEEKDNDQEVHQTRIKRVKRRVVREHRRPNSHAENTSTTGKIAPEKRSIQRAKRGS